MGVEYDEDNNKVYIPEGFTFKKGLFAGIGFMIGWFITRWLLLFLVVIVGMVSVCGMCLKHEEAVDRTFAKLKKMSPVKTSNKLYIPGDNIRYNRVCNIRSGPTTGAKIIGKTEKGAVYKVLGTKGKWKMVQYKDVGGWIGCRPH